MHNERWSCTVNDNVILHDWPNLTLQGCLVKIYVYFGGGCAVKTQQRQRRLNPTRKDANRSRHAKKLQQNLYYAEVVVQFRLLMASWC